MKSVLFTIGSVSIYGYGLMIAIGIIVCVAVAMYRAKRYGIDPDLIFNCAVIGIIAGFIGAKLTYWAVEFEAVKADPHIMLELGNGFVAYGGLVLGPLATILYVKKIKKQSFLDKLDLCVPSIALGQGIGRIGCFLGGCCYGEVLEGHPWYGVVFPEGVLPSSIPAGASLFPSQLVSAAGLVLIFVLLVLITPNSKFRGQVTAVYMMVYSVARFVIEYFRADERGSIGPFSTSQFIGIFIFLIGLVLYFVFRKKALSPLRRLEDVEDETEETEEEGNTEAAEELPEETVEAVAEALSEEAEKAEETAEEAAGEAAEAAEEATEEAAEAVEKVKETAEEAAEAADRKEVPED